MFAHPQEQPAEQEDQDNSESKESEKLQQLTLEQNESLQTQIATRPLRKQLIPVENDNQLQITLEIIQDVHKQFFASRKSGIAGDAGQILSRRRTEVLDGMVICFSGYIRIGDHPRK